MIPTGVLKKYVGSGTILVETGIEAGETIERARAFGAKEIHSIDLVQDRVEAARNRFKEHKHIHLYHGDSGTVLPEIIKKIGTSMVFWLDAHGGGPPPTSPILKELKAIEAHPNKTHTIMVDDIRLFRQKAWGVSLAQVVDGIMAINSQYVITTEDGFAPADIFVARLYL